jgi:hypothetical protein
MATPLLKKHVMQAQQARKKRQEKKAKADRDLFFGAYWSDAYSSEFEDESATTSSTYSFDDTSIISDDLNLYENRCVH